MEQFRKINSTASYIDLKDAIYNKFKKSKAVLTSLMYATEFIHPDMMLDNTTVYNTLGVVDDYLEELELLFEQLEKMQSFDHIPF